jgi:hypothetical protein
MYSGSSGGIGGYSRVGKTPSSGYGSGMNGPSAATNSKLRTTAGSNSIKNGSSTLNNRTPGN